LPVLGLAPAAAGFRAILVPLHSIDPPVPG
jgi:hypothetical protein